MLNYRKAKVDIRVSGAAVRVRAMADIEEVPDLTGRSGEKPRGRNHQSDRGVRPKVRLKA